MSENWAQWEGRQVDNEFRLDRYLGGSDQSGVFLTECGGKKAAIKLLRGEPRQEPGAQLSHPHLIRIFRTGCWQLENTPVVYIVMEFADEVLSQVLADRRLTEEETRELLPPVLSAVAYLHGQGLTHGRLKPGNILSAGEQLKISSDGLRRSGEGGALTKPRGPYDAPELASGQVSPAADVWALGLTLVEALTQRLPVWDDSFTPVLPEGLPEVFRDIASHCLERDPERRWTVAQISARLSTRWLPPLSERPAEPMAASPRRYIVIAAALVLAVLAVIAGARLVRPRPTTQPAPVVNTRGEPTIPAPAATVEPPAPSGRVRGTVEQQVTPEVSRRARETIRGTVKVRVAVRVNASGRVAEAKIDSPRVSRYFSNAALQAARRWRFAPPQVDGRAEASSWTLEFEFSRSGTEMRARPRS